MGVRGEAVDIGPVEGTCDGLRSGRKRRAILAANGATCDLYVLGIDGFLRVFSPKATSQARMRCVRKLEPKLLPPQLLEAAPDFWRQQHDAQERRALEWGCANLGETFEVTHLTHSASKPSALASRATR